MMEWFSGWLVNGKNMSQVVKGDSHIMRGDNKFLRKEWFTGNNSRLVIRWKDGSKLRNKGMRCNFLPGGKSERSRKEEGSGQR